MVFGNLGEDSGTGVCFTRDPSTGKAGAYGDYLVNAQGEDVVSGIRNTLSLDDFAAVDPASHAELRRIMRRLETHYRDLCDIEFTVERGKLWMLQTRVGKRTPAAAFRIATQLVDEQLITTDEALERVGGPQLAQLMFPQFDATADRTVLVAGMAASPGAAVGRAVFDSATAVEWAARGEPVVLVRKETNPDDLSGMIAAAGILTSRGGKTSHAAVVARGMGKTAVCGADGLLVDLEGRRATAGARTSPRAMCCPSTVPPGRCSWVSCRSCRRRSCGCWRTGSRQRSRRRSRPVTRTPASWSGRSTGCCGTRTGCARWRCARTPTPRLMPSAPAGWARRGSACAGPSTCSSATGACSSSARSWPTTRPSVPPPSEPCSSRSARTSSPSWKRWTDCPPPSACWTRRCTSSCPTAPTSWCKVARAEERGQVDEADVRLLAAVNRLHESNPMLGLRGVRLGLTLPGLFAVQIRALAEATAERLRAGGDPRPEVMVPLVGSVMELHLVRDEATALLAEVSAAEGVALDIPIGTMVELPRAALTAHRIAEVADFMSFGTNDLTQTTWGFSRDDVEASFFAAYLDNGVFTVSPFESLDRDGVGRLVALATTEGRATSRT
jgi:pyruvate,orthophosphate dikinase